MRQGRPVPGTWQSSLRSVARRFYRGIQSGLHVLAAPLYCPPGHYLSPIAGAQDVERALRAQPSIDGIDLASSQQALLRDLAQYWHDLPAAPTPGWRYHSSEMFAAGDATIYYAMLRHLRPARIVEVGSGFTSALALDTRDRHLPDLQLIFIEPYPDRLYSLLRSTDPNKCTIVPYPVQDVPLETFDQLRSGDILFVDTSHVAKAGSDVNWLVFNVLPRLVDGVVVHVHDIFWPFEYPQPWLTNGRSWSEVYLLRAFLMFNSRFSILLFNDWLWQHHPDLFTALAPGYSAGTGSLWLQVSRS